MEITKEVLQTIYTRANEYATARFGKKADEIRISEDGTIEAVFSEYNMGEWSSESEYFSAENLTADLDQLAKERTKQEELARREAKRQQQIWDQQQAEQAKRNRKAQYLQLKKEFE